MNLILAFALLAKFDWSEVVDIPTINDPTMGHQVLHFYSRNKQLDEPSREFISARLSQSKQYQSDAEVLRHGSDAVTLKGLYLEFGVCSGRTINFIAALNPLIPIYGFDSFEGLPEDWTEHCKKGTFAFKQQDFLPPVLHNVDLIKGWFSDTLPAFLNARPDPIAFLHIDCDIYSSASYVLQSLADRIKAGTIIVFDELFNYPGFENHELKALDEFLAKTGYRAEYLAYNTNHESVAIKICL